MFPLIPLAVAAGGALIKGISGVLSAKEAEAEQRRRFAEYMGYNLQDEVRSNRMIADTLAGQISSDISQVTTGEARQQAAAGIQPMGVSSRVANVAAGGARQIRTAILGNTLSHQRARDIASRDFSNRPIPPTATDVLGVIGEGMTSGALTAMQLNTQQKLMETNPTTTPDLTSNADTNPWAAKMSATLSPGLKAPSNSPTRTMSLWGSNTTGWDPWTYENLSGKQPPRMSRIPMTF